MNRYNQPVSYYVHVPKTAGTTMRIIFLWLYWWNQILWAKGKDYLADKAQNMSAHDLARIRLVAGHSTFGMHEALPFTNFQYFTILREPVARVLSQYYYLRRQPKHRLYDVVNRYNLSLKTLLEENYLNPNVQTFWMTGADKQNFRGGHYDPEIVEKAKQNIDQYFGFVGLNEYFNESLILLKRQMGWHRYPLYAQKNVTKSRKKQDEESPETLEAIKRYNQMDLELYDYVAAQFHERLAAVNDEDFQAEVDQLQKLNQRFGSYKPYRLKVLSGFISRGVQQFFGSHEKPEVLP
jgi:hypothetical protein